MRASIPHAYNSYLYLDEPWVAFVSKQSGSSVNSMSVNEIFKLQNLMNKILVLVKKH